MSQIVQANTKRFRCIIRDEPATTISIGWDQVSGDNPVVYYGNRDYGKDYQRYPQKVYPQRTVHAKGMHNHFARLKKLKPNTVYYFVVVDSEGSSERYSFRTLPDDHEAQLSIIGGGDSRNLRTARQNANKLVAKLRPHFVMFAGDMTGGDSDKEWKEWLDDWQLTIGKGNRMTAIVPARGNHEFENKTLTDMFDIRHPDIFYALTFARGILRVYTLNSMMASSGEQKSWLENDLRKNQNIAWRYAQYHHPMRPHTRRKRENETLRKNWAPLFERFRMQLVLECDSHTSKYTWPIRSSNDRRADEGFVRDDANGVVYIGEGGWGAPLRDNNDDKKWTRASGKFNQFKWVFVSLDKLEVRTVKTDNAAGVDPLEDATRFTMPLGIDLWQPDGLEALEMINPYSNSFKPLPKQILTEITYAKASAEPSGDIDIAWYTVFEEKNMRYKIQYSSNKLYWKTIANLKGIGANGKKANEYLFTDSSQRRKGKAYYRIVAIDPDGRERYREEVEVRSLSSYYAMELVQSNVHTGILNLFLSLREEQEVLFEIFDVQRKRVFVQRMPLGAGEHPIPLNVRHLQPGHYLLEVSFGRELLRKNIKIYRPSR